ncbi:MAG: hypothetical protein Q5537_03380, partial [Haemophilus parahaemolyticus]|nr:hypothetical protein [Haemophilus parahaemolyticus]
TINCHNARNQTNAPKASCNGYKSRDALSPTAYHNENSRNLIYSYALRYLLYQIGKNDFSSAFEKP